MGIRVKVRVMRDPESRTSDGYEVLANSVMSALRILNYSQTQFHFDFIPGILLAQRSPAVEFHSWSDLQESLAKEKAQLDCDYLVGVTDQPIENNWFSQAIPGANVIFITISSWDYISTLPVSAFIAYEIIQNVVQLMIQRGNESKWLFQNVIHTAETKGCMSDLCVIKPHISFKMRTGDICPDCLGILQGRLETPIMRSIIDMLERTRLVALGRLDESLTSSAIPLAQLVDQRYPFPIAYCFRAMRSELSYSRKWSFMYDVYKLVVKYIAFALLADRSRCTEDELEKLDLSRLTFGSDGHWGRIAFQLTEELMGRGDKSFLSDFANTITLEDLASARDASKNFVTSRNEQQGHGFTGHEQVYQELFERHFEDLRSLLMFIKPLANFNLVTPTGAVQSVASKWAWDAKHMMGSNPSFALRRQVTKEYPNGDCLLLDWNGRFLSLKPWLLLSYCESCFREMVFLYAKMNGDCAEHIEYPTNHSKKNRELGQEIKDRLNLKSA